MTEPMFSLGNPAKFLCRIAGAVVIVFALGSPGPASAQALDFSVSVTGVEDSELEKSVLDALELQNKSGRPIATMRALRRRVDAAAPRLTALLRAKAYYGAVHEAEVTRKPDGAAVVTIRIDLGPAYRLGKYAIRPVGRHHPQATLDVPFSELGLRPGDIALSEKIVEADTRLLAALGRRAYPLARIDARRTVVDHKARTMSVDVSVETGPRAKFGATRIEGLTSVDPALIRRHTGWTRGEPFNSEALEKTRKALRQTGLFSSVLVSRSDSIDGQGELPVTIGVSERKHRSIGAGGSFSTTDGPLGKLFWEHRNLRGHGERLRIRGEAGEIRQGFFGDFRIADFAARNQDLVFDARITKEQPDGFTSIETAAVTRFERRFSDIYAGSAGVGFDRSDVEENDTDRIFTFLTLPFSLRRDTSDDLLDPGKGGRDTLTLTPNIGIAGTSETFFKAQLFDTVYVPLLPEKKLLLAGWARLGAIFGETTLAIPANKRFYSGGAGSVRGYGLNSIGPLDVQGDPVGGRSATEFGAELRWRVTGPFGAVAFAEAGGVYNDLMPDWGSDLQWGAGVGVRYLTKIGPIRLDVAVPLNRRNEIDDAFQILVSLGQAF